LDSHFGCGSTEIITKKELSPIGDNVAIYSGPRASIINIRAYSNGLITVNVDYYLGDGEKPLLTLEVNNSMLLPSMIHSYMALS